MQKKTFYKPHHSPLVEALPLVLLVVVPEEAPHNHRYHDEDNPEDQLEDHPAGTALGLGVRNVLCQFIFFYYILLFLFFVTFFFITNIYYYFYDIL